MSYFITDNDILDCIAACAEAETLWIDTEVADYNTKKPRLSLIQVLDDPTDMTGIHTYILDVLDKPYLVEKFISEIMINPNIEKVFHNASYDLRFLGGKKAENVTCTLEMAKKIPYHILPLSNLQLKTLAEELCNFRDIDKSEQGSDWGQRSLTEDQIEYAHLDCIYLSQVHLKLKHISAAANIAPEIEDLEALAKRYREIEEDWKLLKSEMDNLEERIKEAMQAQNISQTPDFKLTSSQRRTVKIDLLQLANFIQTQGLDLDIPVTLTQKIQEDLGKNLENLNVDIETSTHWRLTKIKED
jgi:ribonuclease D